MLTITHTCRKCFGSCEGTPRRLGAVRFDLRAPVGGSLGTAFAAEQPILFELVVASQRRPAALLMPLIHAFAASQGTLAMLSLRPPNYFLFNFNL